MDSRKLLYVVAGLLGLGTILMADSQKNKDAANGGLDVFIEGAPGAQILPLPPEGNVMFKQEVASDNQEEVIAIDKAGFEGATFSWVASEMSVGAKLVKGAPYSAEAVTETTQTLADGNRIQRKSTASVYRDSEGRTRREQILNQIGPWANSGNAQQMIFINDPVAGVHYVLNPKERTARKMTLPALTARAEGESAAAPHPGHTVMRFERHIGAAGGEAIGFAHVVEGPGPASKPQTESLGRQVIEGVEAEGTRTTITIPAGQIGNEQPIQIVSERWVSPELQTLVLSRHSDPRMGETIYRLSAIDRSEQPKSLFEVPSDYKIEEGGGPALHRFGAMKKPEGGN